jgi:hypothetical protein
LTIRENIEPPTWVAITPWRRQLAATAGSRALVDGHRVFGNLDVHDDSR